MLIARIRPSVRGVRSHLWQPWAVRHSSTGGSSPGGSSPGGSSPDTPREVPPALVPRAERERQKVRGPMAAMAPLENHTTKVQAAKPYVPQVLHKRTLYEFPPPEPPRPQKPIQLRRLQRHFKAILLGLGGAYCVYLAWYWTKYDPEERILGRNHFTPFTVTYKQQVDKDHWLIELTPKPSQLVTDSARLHPMIFDGSRVVLVEVKQPDIMVLRRYTPLPVFFFKDWERPEIPAVMKLVDEHDTLGVLTLYVKQYDQGEVGRWLCSRPLHSVVELCGPHVELWLPKHPVDRYLKRPQMQYIPSKVEADGDFAKVVPQDKWLLLPVYDNLAFYVAGTGIAPALQVLLLPNPYRGFVDIHYSLRLQSEVPVPRFMAFLQFLDRVKWHYYEGEQGVRLTKTDSPGARMFDPNRPQALATVPRWETEHPLHTPLLALAEAQAALTRPQAKRKPLLAVVCGPEGYVAAVAGPRHEHEPDPVDRQGPLGGMLKTAGWELDAVHKL